MIICNGAYKTGTHLLWKAVLMFGYEFNPESHRHDPYPHSYADTDKHLHITRSPRNVVASWLKFNKIPFSEENYIGQIEYIIDNMSVYVGWLSAPNTLNIKFEELLTDPNQINVIAEFIGMEPVENHFIDLWGQTPTFTPDPSIWRDFWTPVIATKWVESGGLELEMALGYDPMKVWVREI